MYLSHREETAICKETEHAMWEPHHTQRSRHASVIFRSDVPPPAGLSRLESSAKKSWDEVRLDLNLSDATRKSSTCQSQLRSEEGGFVPAVFPPITLVGVHWVPEAAIPNVEPTWTDSPWIKDPLWLVSRSLTTCLSRGLITSSELGPVVFVK